MRKRYTKKSIYKLSLITISFVLLAFFFGYIIFETDCLQSGIDELTASYISFNNAKSTDALNINDISKKNDKKGKTQNNKSNKSFEVKGKENQEFEVILYTSGNDIDEKYIKYFLLRGKEEKEGNLASTEKTIDNGKIIYKGKINKYNKFKLFLWIDDNYDKSIKNISYEIKIKTR